MKLRLLEYAPFLLDRAGSSVAAALGAILETYGLTLPMWLLLVATDQKGGQRMGELADVTGLEVWTVSRVVKAMEGDGLVERRRESADERAVTVRLTNRGRELVGEILPVAQHYERIVLGGLDSAEVATLRATLRKLLVNVKQAEALEVETQAAQKTKASA